MATKKDTLDSLLAGHDPQAVFAKDGLFDELKKVSRGRLRCFGALRRRRRGYPAYA